MADRIWTSGVFCPDTNTKFITGLWDNQELAGYALGGILKSPGYNLLLGTFFAKLMTNTVSANTFIAEVQNNNDGTKVYTTLIEWNIDCWITYIKNFGLTSEVIEKLQQLALEDVVLQAINT